MVRCIKAFRRDAEKDPRDAGATLRALVFCGVNGMLWALMSVKVKICGITNAADALAAVESGADALGFMFYEPSPRHVAIRQVAEIIRELPPFVMRAGVFVDAPEDTVMRAIGDCGLTLLQFHGQEPPEYCTQFGLMSMKAFRMRDAESLKVLQNYPTDAWLLDAFVVDKLGGTGEKFNWELAIEAKKLGRPIFLAGGLTPMNVAEAVRTVHPFAVDVSSGVEASPGKKDHAKVRDFIAAAKSGEMPGNAF
jgi:phosphoribosylanthranilate isomerase